LIITWRFLLPETNHFLVHKAEREAKQAQLALSEDHTNKAGSLRAFARDAGFALKSNWVLIVYMVVLMSGYNSVSHGSQDLFPTFLKSQVYMDPSRVTAVTVVGQIGALLGSTFVGYVSTFTGRRPAMMLACVCGGALVPAYIFIRTDALIATCFFEQFFVGGSWGPVPVRGPYLMMSSPD